MILPMIGENQTTVWLFHFNGEISKPYESKEKAQLELKLAYEREIERRKNNPR